MTILLTLLLLFTFQSPEYGKPEELKGVKRVFVDTGTNLRDRERIMKELEKSKLGLEVLESEEGAEAVLAFGASTERRVGTVTHAPGSSTPVYRRVKQGEGQVFVLRDNRTRLVLSFADEKSRLLEREPATNFARAFVKAYKKANGVK